MRALFLDRDGVVNEAPPRGSYITRPEELVLVEGIKDVLRFANKNTIPVFIVTNQGQVSRGIISKEELHAIHARLFELFDEAHVWVDKLYCCTHHDADNCSYRKPSPGMLLRAAQEFGIELKESLFIGDSSRDVEAGNRAHVKTILLRNKWNEEDLHKATPDFVIESLTEVMGIF